MLQARFPFGNMDGLPEEEEEEVSLLQPTGPAFLPVKCSNATL